MKLFLCLPTAKRKTAFHPLDDSRRPWSPEKSTFVFGFVVFREQII